jgi:Zn-dependent protease with chaperone function
MQNEDAPKLEVSTFYDGVFAREHQVEVTLHDQSLLISAETLSESREWAYADMRTVADLASQVGVSYRVTDGLGRLEVKNEALILRLENLAINHNKSDISKSSWKRIGIWGVGAIVSVAVIVFVLIPALSNQLATMIPVEREIALGRTSIKQIERFLSFDDDRPLTCRGAKGQVALDKMTARFSAHVDSPYPLDIKVFNHEMPNAFAVPGGHIVLFDGLIQDADSPEEVAAVLGHEIGHVINRDPTRLTLRSAGSVGILGMVFGDFAGGAVALIIAEQLIAADYSQEAEANADIFAHKLMADAELPSKPMARFFEKLHDEFGDEPGFLSHLSSHPDLLGRAEAAKAADTIEDRSYKAVLTTSEWNDLKAMCTKQKEDAKASKSE